MSLPWSDKGVKLVPVDADQLMIIDSEESEPVDQNKRITIGSLPSAGEINTASNIGTGLGWFDAKIGVDLEFKSVLATSPIIITSVIDDLVFSLDPLVNADISASAAIDFSKLESLSDGNILVGSGTDIATSVTMSGDATIINSGVLTISDNAITDDKTDTFTTTKISTTNKTLLNSAIVYTDQTNTFGDFAQIFTDDTLFIQNPAGDFTYQIISDAIIANRTLTFPLLTGNDIFVTEAFAQILTNKTLTSPVISTISNTGTLTLPTSTDTLVGRATMDVFTNKTFDANATGNSLSNVDVEDLADGVDGELITWSSTGVAATVGVGTATQVLTSNGPGAAPTFQSPASGGHVIQDEGTPLTQRTNLDFVGLGVTVTDGGAGPDSTIVTIPSGGASSLNDLTDVTITSAAANQILIYNAGATAMENQTMGGDASIAANGTVTLTSTVVQTDQANTWSTGIQSFVSAANLRIPVSANPTIGVDGDIAFDTTVPDFTTSGLIRFFGGIEQAIVAMPIGQFTTPTDGNVVAYNATNDEFELVTSSGGGGITGLEPNSTILEYTTDLTDYTTPTAATATSSNGGQTPDLTIDDNTTTFWESNAGINESITLDMGSVVNCYGLAYFISTAELATMTETQFQIKGRISTEVTDLRSYWKFDESSSPVLNKAADVGSLSPLADADAVITGGTFLQTGIIDDSVLFDGTTSSGAVGTSTTQYDFLHESTQSTVVFWYKFTASNLNPQVIFDTSNTVAGVDGLFLQLDRGNDDKIRYALRANSVTVIDQRTTANFFPDDLNFHMVAVQLDWTQTSGTVRITVDGGTSVEVFNHTVTNGTGPHTAMTIAAQNALAQRFAGNLDEFSIWSRRLTDDEITRLYNNGAARAIENPPLTLRTLNTTELTPDVYNFIRFNGINTQFLTIEGSSGGSLVMVANELEVQIEADPPLTTLHGQFTIPTITGTPLNGGDPTSSVIEDPIINTITYNNVSTPGDPALEKGLMWLETLDGNNNIINAKIKNQGIIQTFQVVPPSGGGITGLEPNSTILEYTTDIDDYTTPTDATATSEKSVIPDFLDDFSVADWTEQDSAMIGVSGGVMDGQFERNNTNDGASKSMGLTVDGNFVYRITQTIGTLDPGAASGKAGYYGVSSSNSLDTDADTQTFFGFKNNISSGSNSMFVHISINEIPNIAGNIGTFTAIMVNGETWGKELIIDGLNWTANLYTDGDFTLFPVETLSGTFSAGRTDCTFAKFMNQEGSLVTGSWSATFDNFEIFNNITSATQSPLLAIDGDTSRFWESNAGINESITLDMGSVVNCYGLAYFISTAELATMTETQFQISATGNFDLTGLESYWKFNDVSTPVINNASQIGSPASLGINADMVVTGGLFQQAGVLNSISAVDFNGTSDNGVVGSSLSQYNFLHEPNAKWTIIYWYANDAPSTTSPIVWDDSNAQTGSGLLIQHRSDFGLKLGLHDAGAQWESIATSILPNDNDFHMVAMTMDLTLVTDSYKVSVDDGTKQLFTKSGTQSSGDGGNAPRIGSLNNLTAFYNGRFTEWTIFNRVLTDAEITSLFNNGNGRALAPNVSTLLRTLNTSELTPDVYNFIRFNGVNTQLLQIEGSSGNSLVMVANELAVQLETDPPLTTLHGQFTIPTIAGTALNGGDPTSSVIDDPIINTMTFNNVSTPSNPAAGKGNMWVETVDADNEGLFMNIKVAGSFQKVRIL